MLLNLLNGFENENVMKITQQQQLKMNWMRLALNPTLFSEKSKRNSFIICLLLTFFHQFSGINLIKFNLHQFFYTIRSERNVNMFILNLEIIQVLMMFASAVLVECVGRKPLLIFSSFAMFLSLSGLFFYSEFNYTSYHIPLICFVGSQQVIGTEIFMHIVFYWRLR